MKKILAVFMVSAAFVCMATMGFSQTAPAVTPAAPAASGAIPSGFTALPLTPNIPNMWLAEPGEHSFVATGVGLTLLQYDHTFAYGGALEATLQAIGAAKVTGPHAGDSIVGGTLGLDALKFVTGVAGVKIVGNWSLTLGPSFGYDTVRGKGCYGGGGTFSYVY